MNFEYNNKVTVFCTGGKVVYEKGNKNSCWDFIMLLSVWFVWFCLLLIFSLATSMAMPDKPPSPGS